MTTLMNSNQPSPSIISSLKIPLWILATLASIYLMKIAAGLFIWIICAVFLLALLNPSFEYLKAKGLSATFASTLLILGVMLTSLVFIYFFFYFSSDIFADLSESKKILSEQYLQLKRFLDESIGSLTGALGGNPKDLMTGKPIPKVQVITSSPLAGVPGNSIVTGVGSAVAILTYFFLCPVLTLFMLNEKNILGPVFQKIFPTPELAKQAWSEISGVIKAFFIGNFLLFVFTIPLFSIVFKIFSLNSFFILAVLASFINLIPFVGSVLTGLLPALFILAQTKDASSAFWVYTICLFLHFLIANFIMPAIIGPRLRMNATVSMLSLFVWGLIWGPMGILLAIPLTATIKVILTYSGNTHLKNLAAAFEMDHVQVRNFRVFLSKKKVVPT